MKASQGSIVILFFTLLLNVISKESAQIIDTKQNNKKIVDDSDLKNKSSMQNGIDGFFNNIDTDTTSTISTLLIVTEPQKNNRVTIIVLSTVLPILMILILIVLIVYCKQQLRSLIERIFEKIRRKGNMRQPDHPEINNDPSVGVNLLETNQTENTNQNSNHTVVPVDQFHS